MRTPGKSGIRLLAYPGGKRFAFTIIDDTDMSTLESIRPVYELLFSLGLRTTKTVWVARPLEAPERPSDTGDTLERREYADYMRLLRNRGFEIALHNIASRSSTRENIAAGIEAFRDALGEYPSVNVHHEKNRENLYFEFAQRGGRRPPAFRTPVFRGLRRLLGRNGGPRRIDGCGCCGEDVRGEYFWGDLCREKIKYLRTNVFFEDLNTLKCNPLMPYASSETPFVNYWFDASNGQDSRRFNAILSEHNIAALKNEAGCSILYTHFGMGFVEAGGNLNAETRRRLEAVAGDSDGWYCPVSEILDRLRAFQEVGVLPLPGGIAVANRNPFDIPAVTLCGPAAGAYRILGRDEVLVADGRGLIVLPVLPASTVMVLLRRDMALDPRPWYEERANPWILDLETAARKMRTHWFGNA
jgi:hypothetical protein